ncbi:hypothetical protein [Streptomyces sp. NPDC090036]|uniref:hypothetical protein n=1 Tax=Streptomyces sp. NPDC090036 TaxID=3365926 RepID=UPI00382D2DDD
MPQDDVISLGPKADWARSYDLENANANPAVFRVAATGGPAVQYGNTAGRLARQALFHLIQPQTPQPGCRVPG